MIQMYVLYVNGHTHKLPWCRCYNNSESFVAAAKKIQSGEQLTMKVPIEGDIYEEVTVVQEPGVNPTVMNRVNFFQGDACSLSDYTENKKGFGTFDGVIMSNLLCRLPDPLACLNAMPMLVNKGGVVVIVTPFTWLEGMYVHMIDISYMSFFKLLIHTSVLTVSRLLRVHS